MSADEASLGECGCEIAKRVNRSQWETQNVSLLEFYLQCALSSQQLSTKKQLLRKIALLLDITLLKLEEVKRNLTTFHIDATLRSEDPDFIQWNMWQVAMLLDETVVDAYKLTQIVDDFGIEPDLLDCYWTRRSLVETLPFLATSTTGIS